MIQSIKKRHEVAIYEFSSDAIKKSKQPKWKSTFCKSDDGLLFFPVALFGDEAMEILLAGYDGATSMTYRNHFFVNHEWLLKEKKGRSLELVNLLIRIANS